MSTLKIAVLYDRVWEDDAADAAPATDKAPVTRTLDKKEVEEEVAEALTKLGHAPTMHELDGTPKSLLALARLECDLVFNLTESFGNDDTADFKIAGFMELVGKRYTGSGTHGLLLAQDKAVAKKIFAFHGIHTPVFAKSFRGRLDFSHDLQFPVIVKPAREDGSIGIEFSAVVNSIRELMERMDWLHAHFDSPVLIEEYIEGRELYVGVIGNERLEAFPVWEMSFDRMPENRWRIATERVKWSTQYQKRNGIMTAQARLDAAASERIQKVAKRAYRALDLNGYARIDVRMDEEGRAFVLEANPNPNLAYGEDFAESGEVAGVTYEKLLDRILALGLRWEPARTG